MATTTRTGEVNAFTLEIIRSYLISTVEEMAEATKRSAYSTVISEALDFACGLFDARGRMIAQAAGLPLFAGTLPAAMKAIQDRFDDFLPGDVYIVADPYIAGLHHADVLVCRPLFWEDELFAFAVNRAHWLDVGGMAAGGWAGTATHVVQEGIRITPLRIMRAGVLDEPLRDFILANVRLPAADWADFQSQVAATVVAERRIRSLLERHGFDAVTAGIESALAYSSKRMEAALAVLPDGSWSGEEVFEDDGHGGGPHYIRVTLTKEQGRLLADFSASDPQVMAPINCSEMSTYSAVCVASLSVLDPEIPLNSGLLDYIAMRTEPGTLVHPVFPAPVFFSTADPSIKACEAVLKAFAEVVPERVPAGGFQTGNNITGSGTTADGSPFQWFLFGAGGNGARLTLDGMTAEWHVMANCRNESAELWEHRYPVRVEELSLVENSGGRGRTRGGLGYRRRLRMLAPTAVSSIADRQVIPPWGLDGGESGRPNRFAVVSESGATTSLQQRFGLQTNSKFTNVALDAGDALLVESGGGGGCGPVAERDPELVSRDIEFGYVSADEWPEFGAR
jgi:N-methylhydantoinase B/oxoprolinase/acetone carboxylase alpha subunit